MDPGTKAASIQSCDTAAALFFRIATAVFDGLGVSPADPADKERGYGVWLSLRTIAAQCARGREIPPPGITSQDLTTLLEGAHFYAAKGAFGDSRGNLRVPSFHLCDCDVSNLCRSAVALIFTPSGDTPLNSLVREGGRGQLPEPAGTRETVPASLARFPDEETLGTDPL